jgi:signal transduction histidine kinase
VLPKIGNPRLHLEISEGCIKGHDRRLRPRKRPHRRCSTKSRTRNRQLQQASEHKSQFVSSVSHELRTPLNAIIGLTEMMVKNAARFGTEKAQEPLQRVNRAGTHLLGLISRCSICRRSRPESSSFTHKPCS